jgi:CHRD domain
MAPSQSTTGGGVAVRRRRLQLAAVVAVLGLLGVVAAAVAGGGSRDVREHLTGYEETPQTLSTTGFGDFRAKVRDHEISYRLSYGGLEGDVLQAHIHLGREATSGGISAFLCSNLGNGPAGTPLCPGTVSGSVEGTIEPADVIGPTGQGIGPGEYAELLRAIRAGATYANVHSSKYPSGEVRAQIERGHDR